MTTQGVRVYPKADGWLDAGEIDKPAHYGRAIATTAPSGFSAFMEGEK